jgi:hypothetical protein
MPGSNEFAQETCFVHLRNFAQPAQLPAGHNIIDWVYFEFLIQEFVRKPVHLNFHPVDI